MKESRKDILIYLLLCGLGVLFYCTRFFVKGIPYYHPEDTYFHLSRLISFENVWTSPVNFHIFKGNGTYTNLYYPWLTVYPMWILFKICGSYVAAYNLYNTVLSIASLLISYQCMKRMISDRTASVCFAVLYSFSSYKFVNVFRRSALGESVAMAFLPIILLGTWLIFFEDYKAWRTLSIGIALSAYTHILTVLLAWAVFFVLLLATFYWWDEKGARLAACMKAVFFGAAMSAGFFLPMIQASHWNPIYHPEGRLDLIMEHNDPLAVILGNSISNLPTAHSIGLLTCLALAGTLYLLVNRRPDAQKLSRRPAVRNRDGGTSGNRRRIAGFYFVIGLLLVISASSIMPWTQIGRSATLSIIQFPWRLNAYSTLLIAAAFSMTLTFVKEKTRRVTALIIGLSAVLLTWSSVFALKEEELERITETTVRTMDYSYHRYMPRTAREYLDQVGDTLDLCYLDGMEISPDKNVSADGTSLYVEIEDGKKGQLLDLPAYWFTTLRARVNGKAVETVMSERGTVLIPLPADGKNAVELYHVYSKLTYCSWLFSFCIFLFVIASRCLRLSH